MHVRSLAILLLPVSALSSQVVQAPLTPSKPAIDTVKRIERVTNTGWTAWRGGDVTSWTMSLIRTVGLQTEGPGGLGWDAINAKINVQALPPDKIVSVAMRPDGSVLVARFAPATVEYYDSTGKFIRAIGELGSAPNQYQGLGSVAVSGDTVVVHDNKIGRALVYLLDGTFVRGFSTKMLNEEHQIGFDSRGRLRIEEDHYVAGRLELRWVFFSLDGRRVDSLVGPDPDPGYRAWTVRVNNTVKALPIPMVPVHVTAITPDNRIFTGRTDLYNFELLKSRRDTLRLITRNDYQPVPISRAFADSFIATLRAQGPTPWPWEGVAKISDFPPNFPPWNDLATDERGNLWVASDIRTAVRQEFHVYSPDGRYLGPVPSQLPGLKNGSWSDGYLALPTRDASRRWVVQIYRINRRGQ